MAWVNGGVASQEAAAARAAQILSAARRPLIAGFGPVSIEAQRIAVAIADRLGGVADWTSSAEDAAAPLAFQTVGAVAASYGEVAERTDLVVRWCCEESERLLAATADAETVEIGSLDLPLRDGADYEAISTLRALLAEVALDGAAVGACTGVSLDAWRGLADRMIEARYVVVIRGKRLSLGGPAAVAALTQLAQELHAHSRAAVVSPFSSGNRPGAENVLAWQSGFPMAVDFGRGYPRYSPGEFSSPVVQERGEVDAVLSTRDEKESALTIVVKSHEGEAAFRVASLRSGGGTHHRSDGAVLTLPRTADLPTAADVLKEIDAALPANS